MIDITRQYICLLKYVPILLSPDFPPYTIRYPLDLLRTGPQVHLPPVPQPPELLGPEAQLGDHLL